ncbi:MAG TPA: PaaI family thioesterase [Polyangiaceae bacterium]|jgi:acyl-coenzyme A thioesterase PaaI-like protein|nr:PaaI family thioesterase [Polyangiaceae bacterium]
MNSLADIVRHAKERADFTPIVDAIPYLGFLGVSVDLSGGELIGKMRYAESNIGNATLPALHGGTIGALLESTAILQILWETEAAIVPKIVTITIDYLRSGKPVDTFARGVITKQGRRIVNVGVEAWQDDRSRPIARANTHFLVEPA